jgi:hypothetical protein
MIFIIITTIIIVYAGIMLVNVVYSYKFNRSKSKFQELFLKTESCADSV